MRSLPWYILQHVPYEGPGTIATLAAERGLPLEVIETPHRTTWPAIHELGGLIVLGGPASITTAEQHPYLARERDLIAAAVAADKPVLGICLGAQLLAWALGGRVYTGPSPEVGFGWVYLTPAARRDPVFADEQDPLPVFHWHSDTFDLPPGTVWLARSDAYRHQAFRTGRCAYGLQFHIEVDATLWAGWTSHLPPEVGAAAALCRPGIEIRGRRILAAFFEAATTPTAGSASG